MPKRSTRFQRLIAAISHCLAVDSRVQESALLVDKVTGAQREVDICIQGRLEPYRVVICMEVFDHGRKATTPWVEQMAQKHANLQSDKLLLVSRAGFTSPAVKKAAFLNIETLTLNDALKTDWDLAVKLLGQGVFVLYNLSFYCEALVEGAPKPEPASLTARLYSSPTANPINVAAVVGLFLSDARVKRTIMDRVDSSNERHFTLAYSPPEGILYEKPDGSLVALKDLRLFIEIKDERTPVNWSLGQFLGKEIVYGESMPADGNFCIAMKRNDSGQVDGVLYSHGDFRKLEGDPI